MELEREKIGTTRKGLMPQWPGHSVGMDRTPNFRYAFRKDEMGSS